MHATATKQHSETRQHAHTEGSLAKTRQMMRGTLTRHRHSLHENAVHTKHVYFLGLTDFFNLIIDLMTAHCQPIDRN